MRTRRPPKANKLLLLCALPLLTLGFSACFTDDVDEHKKSDGASTPEPLFTDSQMPPYKRYQQAMEAEKKGQWRQAARLYLEVENTGDREFFEAAVLSRTRCFMMTNDYDAALNALTPLSEDPRTIFECRKLAMAARIKAKRGDYKDAEMLLAVAIHEVPAIPSTELFRAEALFAIHQIYVQNKKPDQALASIKMAAELFESNGQRDRAKTCREIAEYMTAQ